MKAKIKLNYICLLACGLLLLRPAIAQKVVEKTVPYKEGQQISLELPIGKTINVRGWDKNQVALTATVNLNNNTLNEAYQLKVEEGEQIRIVASLDEALLEGGRAEDCQDGSNFSSMRYGEGFTVCADIAYELKVPRTAALKLETINADVEVKGLEGPAQLKSISGFIDFSWPQQKEAELKLQSTTGELYTDLSFDMLNKEDNPPIVGYMLKGRKGEGGPMLELETISSNIYLRKE